MKCWNGYMWQQHTHTKKFLRKESYLEQTRWGKMKNRQIENTPIIGRRNKKEPGDKITNIHHNVKRLSKTTVCKHKGNTPMLVKWEFKWALSKFCWQTKQKELVTLNVSFSCNSIHPEWEGEGCRHLKTWWWIITKPDCMHKCTFTGMS